MPFPFYDEHLLGLFTFVEQNASSQKAVPDAWSISAPWSGNTFLLGLSNTPEAVSKNVSNSLL